MVAATSPDSAPAVAVVTVSFGSSAVLTGFIASLAAASTDPLLVVVADNKPDGTSGVRAQVESAGLRYLPLPENRGYGGAVNAAVATLPESVLWILVSNPDVVLAPRAIDALLAAADDDGGVGSVGPSIRAETGEVYPSARAVPSLRTGVGHALFANLWTTNPWTRAYRKDAEANVERRDAGWLSGACVLVRRTAFVELGGFDEGFFMYFEDVDLGYRLGKAGYRNVYEPAAVVTHAGAHSTSADSERMIKAHHESAKRFLGKKYAGWLLWPIRAGLHLGLAVRSALVTRKLRH